MGDLDDPNALFVEGLTGADGDEALLLNGDRYLRLPRGQKTGEAAYEYVDYERGTLEFWLRPQWTSRLGTEKKQRAVLSPDAWLFHHWVIMDEGIRGHEKSGFHFLATPEKGTGVIPDRKYNHTPLDQGRWYHLALCWDTVPGRGWLSQLYVDGKPGEPVNPGDFRLARFAALEGQDPPRWRVRPMGRPFMLKGEFEAVVDEVRVSSVVRYPTDFEPDPKKPFARDEQTLLLLRLDGGVKALTAEAERQIEATLRK